jgi:hypothetical protein
LLLLRVPKKNIKSKAAMETVPEFVPEENPFGFFNYLKLCKGSYGFHLLSEVNTNILYHVKPMEYYEVMTFKTYICEIVFNDLDSIM